MNPNDFDEKMRALEYFHASARAAGVWPVLRLDGRSFSRLTESRFEKPFDFRFHELMCGTTEALVAELGGVYGYTESDEISAACRHFRRLQPIGRKAGVDRGLHRRRDVLARGTGLRRSSTAASGSATQPAFVVDYFHCDRQTPRVAR